MSKSALLRAVIEAMPGLTTAGVASRAGIDNKIANRLLHNMKDHSRIHYVPGTPPSAGGTWFPLTVPVPRSTTYRPRGLMQRTVLGAVTAHLQTTKEVAAAAGITRVQAKECLRSLASRGLVTQVRGSWDSFWILPNCEHAAIDEHDEPWTPQPWVHPIRARALGVSLSHSFP